MAQTEHHLHKLFSTRFIFSLGTWHSMKQAKLAMFRVFACEFLLQLYNDCYPHDETVLLKPSLQGLTEFYNILSAAYLEVRDSVLAVNVDTEIPNFKASFLNFRDFFEFWLPAVCILQLTILIL